MEQPFDLATLPWKTVRPDVTSGVFGRALLDGKVKAVLTRVEPGGGFRDHTDGYAHLFYFLSGQGQLWVDGRQSEARPGVVARIPAGVSHAYSNTGPEDLVLLSMNLPALD
jgi:mannose-6-phosphate isomerase-like protein (cupin superfamily)